MSMKMVNSLMRFVLAFFVIGGAGYLLFKFVTGGFENNDLLIFFTGAGATAIGQIITFYFRTSSRAEKEKPEEGETK